MTIDIYKPLRIGQVYDRGARDAIEVLQDRQITGAGLATGGGDLHADRVITVAKASGAEAAAGTNDAKAVTPLALATPLATRDAAITAAQDDATQALADAAAAQASADDAQGDATQALAETAGLGLPERPGDAPAIYGESLTGEASAAVRVPAAWVVNSAAGRVLRVDGAVADDPQIVAPIAPIAIEAGRVYDLRWRVQRITDPGDPLNDSVTIAIRWLDGDKAGIAGGSGTAVIEDIPLEIADGVQERTARVATAAGPGIDHVAPAGAVYCRPYVEMHGGSHVTDVILIGRADVTGPLTLGALVIPLLDDDPATGPGAGRWALYGVANGDGTATLRVQGGTSATPTDLIIEFGGGV